MKRSENQSVYGGPVGSIVIWLLTWACSSPLNYYGNRSWILLLPAISIIITVAFSIHKYVYLHKKTKWLYVANLVSIPVLVLTIFIVKFENEAQQFPTVSPLRIQLATDKETVRNAVTVFNPNDFPLYDAMLRVAIDRPGVTANSLLIVNDAAPQSQTNFNDIPVNVLRMNAGNSNKFPEIVYIRLGFIPPKSNRELRISGSFITNSWASLSVAEYKRDLAISDYRSNVIGIVMPADSAIWKDAKKGILFPMTNLQFGAVFLTNGVPVYTNLPHLSLALDTPDFGTANQFNLTNDFIWFTNNQIQFPRTNGLLEIPSDIPSPTLKLWLVNDSAIGVTNINVTFTSMAGFSFQTNDVWRENAEVFNGVTNSGTVHCDFLSAERTIMLPTLKFPGLKNDAAPALIGICVTATNMPMQLSSFWMAFHPTNVLQKPRLIKVFSSVVVSNNNAFFSMLPVAASKSVEQTANGPKRPTSDERFALTLIFSIVALLVVSVVIYAVCMDGQS